MAGKHITIDGNTAAAYVAHATNEVIAIYPITPSSVMGELADEYSAHGRANIWGQVPRVVELQSEGGASGAIHGALTGGALATTFTASQGLLLMIPNMFKISGELAPTVFHISARSISCQALSIFGDHSDIMCARSSGFGIVLSGSLQEVMDNALVAQQATLKSRVPFLHAFDGFRTSHEIQKIEEIPYDVMRQMIDEEDIVAVRSRALKPETPTMRGTAQNPDLYFQGRESVNPHYDRCPDIVQAAYDRFAKLTGRQYKLFDYYGAPDAEVVVVIMGSGAETAEEAATYMHRTECQKCGLIKVRLYRPFSTKHFLAALPNTVRTVVAMDRTKEPGSGGEPLYLDVNAACVEGAHAGKFSALPLVIGGRYGLSSKEFTPAMVRAAFKHAQSGAPFTGFTVGIHDDVTHRSLDFSEEMDSEHPSTYRAKFYGLGADGTVGASKNTIKVFGENTDKYVQGFFVYDSKKAGGVTCSHLRFSDEPIKSTYLISRPDFVAIHAESFLGRIDLLKGIKEGGSVLINTYVPPDKLFDSLPRREQETIINKKLKLYCINAYEIAKELGIPGRINTTMQAAFFKVSSVLPEETYTQAIEGAITKTYSTKGQEVVDMNVAAFRKGKEMVVAVPVPDKITVSGADAEAIDIEDPLISEFYDDVIHPVIKQDGDLVPVSRMPADGAFSTATSQFEKRSIATHLPKWNPQFCIQCGNCSFVCPHAAVRVKVHSKSAVQLPHDLYVTVPYKDKQATEEDVYRVQVFPDDCTGCAACATYCPGKEKVDKAETDRKALEMVLKAETLEKEQKTVKEFLRLPETDKKFIRIHTAKGSQFKRPLLEFSGACGGCGETPYIKLVTQLFGDRMMQANATGCSSIWGGTAPTSPFCVNAQGRGPAWSSSLFEDNAEFGYGMRLGVNALHHKAYVMRDCLLA
ncbi:MAG: pyruvate:ferredoxin (flavodoxin) oxidoreductase, partial [Candidatus Riflebacteria bacterium RBG_13_59_9]